MFSHPARPRRSGVGLFGKMGNVSEGPGPQGGHDQYDAGPDRRIPLPRPRPRPRTDSSVGRPGHRHRREGDGTRVRGSRQGDGQGRQDRSVGRARKMAGAQGAQESGLNRLIELHASNAAGDAAVAIALAGTIFFAGATSEAARTRSPCSSVSPCCPSRSSRPLIGPFLDRFSYGRRWAIGATFAIRAFLCWVLAGAVADDSFWFYPAALGVLVASKAYGVTSAAAVPAAAARREIHWSRPTAGSPWPASSAPACPHRSPVGRRTSVLTGRCASPSSSS